MTTGSSAIIMINIWLAEMSNLCYNTRSTTVMISVSIADRVFFGTAFYASIRPSNFLILPTASGLTPCDTDLDKRNSAFGFTKFIGLHWVLLVPDGLIQISLTMANGLPFSLSLIDVGKSMDSCVMFKLVSNHTLIARP